MISSMETVMRTFSEQVAAVPRGDSTTKLASPASASSLSGLCLQEEGHVSRLPLQPPALPPPADGRPLPPCWTLGSRFSDSWRCGGLGSHSRRRASGQVRAGASLCADCWFCPGLVV